MAETASREQRLKRVVDGLAAYGAERGILFGSCARGDADSFSDIDLVVIKKTDRRFLDRLLDVVEHIKPNFALDVLVYTPEEFERMREAGNPLIARVIEEGEVIYERPEG